MGASPSKTSGGGPDESSDRIVIGSLLDGRYRIEAIVGTGGMGRVYRGEHVGIGRAVAVKVLHHDLHRNREAAQRFQREAIASGRLDHPNIVNIYDFGVLPHGACYLVMELLEGETLGERLDREGRIPWREAVAILRGVLLGLRHAHERGVVHRDIKPDNVYLARKDGDLIVKILDFGIAKLRAGSTDDPASTRAGLTVGTPAYLSPEQAVGGEITPASDLYSASIVMYEMLTGRAPFEDKDPLAMLGAHVSRAVPTLAEAAPDLVADEPGADPARVVPPALETVMRAGLVKAAAERIRTAQEYLARLEGALEAPRPPGRASAGTPLAAVAAARALGGAAAYGAVQALPGMRAPASPAAAPDQSLVISTGALDAATPPPGAALEADAVSWPAAGPPLGGTVTGAALPLEARTVSIVGGEPVPRRWLVAGGAMIALLTVGAVVLSKTAGGDYDPSSGRGSESALGSAGDRELKLKALIHDLQNGAACADRRAAIAPLVALGDERAVLALREARVRMRPGAGGAAENTNACLTRDLEQALRALATPVDPEPRSP
jgi:serine/threonine-protein kinase